MFYFFFISTVYRVYSNLVDCVKVFLLAVMECRIFILYFYFYTQIGFSMSSHRYPVVMLIDDNELDNFINKKLLENEHFASNILIHQSAINALDELKKKATTPGELPNVIFLDIMMPGMDGFGFLEEFDKLPEQVKNHSKVVMLSTSESFKDLNKANQSRYVYKFLNKPLNKAILDAINV